MKISGGIGGFLENETFITEHLEGLRDMLLFEDHSVNDVTASCMRDGWAEVRVSTSVISKAVRRNFFVGGQDLQYCRGNASEGAKRPSGGRVWEGGVPPPRRRSFCIFEIEIERSGAHFGWIFLGKLSVKK